MGGFNHATTTRRGGEKVEDDKDEDDDTRPRAGENDLPRKVIFMSLTFVGNR